jgi:hypothetical protein
MCSETVCAHCAAATQRCCLAPASCAVSLCGSCVHAFPAFFTLCDDCGARACPAHTHICSSCTLKPTLPPGHGFAAPLLAHVLGTGGHRAMMQCCECQRTYCHACDPGRSGQAGELFDEETDDANVDACVFCCSWPRFCTGLTHAKMESLQWQIDYQESHAERAAAAAQDRAAAAAADSALAAAAAAAADVVARAAAASALAAQEAAREAAEEQQELISLQVQLEAARAALP